MAEPHASVGPPAPVGAAPRGAARADGRADRGGGRRPLDRVSLPRQVLAGGVAGLLRRERKGGQRPRSPGRSRGPSSRSCSRASSAARRTRRPGSRRAPRARSPQQCVCADGKSRRGPEGAAQDPRKKGRAQAEAFKAELAAKLAAASAGVEGQRCGCGCSTSTGYDLLPVIRRCWALRGVRVHVSYATKYQWGCLHEALEVDGANKLELFLEPAIDQDIHALFLRQIGESDPGARHLIIQDQAGFHLRAGDPRLPANVRLLPLPPYSPELNPVERLGDLVKDASATGCSRTCGRWRTPSSAELEPLRQDGRRVAQLIGDGWLSVQANSGGPA